MTKTGPTKTDNSFMVMNTTVFTKDLLPRVHKEFSRLEYEVVTTMVVDLHTEFREYNTERKRTSRKKV